MVNTQNIPERALAAAPLVLRSAAERRRAARGSVQLGRRRPSCRTRLVVCREFELWPTSGRTQPVFLVRKMMVRPERFELPTKYLYYINKYFINFLHIACTGM